MSNAQWKLIEKRLPAPQTAGRPSSGGALIQWVWGFRPWRRLRLEIVKRTDKLSGFKVLPRRWVVERTSG